MLADIYQSFLSRALGQDQEFSDVMLLGEGAPPLWPDQTPCPPGRGEQGLTLMAAGMAYGGRRVVLAGATSLLLGRAYEQIRSTIALSALPVCLVGCDSGFSAGYGGAARQMFEDIALMRSLPGMTLLVPSDWSASVILLREAVRRRRPGFMRLAANQVTHLEDEDARMRLSGVRTLRTGEDITLCACGIMVGEALKAADILAQQDIHAEVIDCYCLSPFPARPILSSLQKTGCCVTAEEHFLAGGLFEAVAGLSAQEYPAPVQPVAVNGGFGQSGITPDLKEYYGLTASRIVSAAVLAWTRRRR